MFYSLNKNLVLYLMLPKLEGKNSGKDIIPYQMFNKEISLRNERDTSNIAKLKQLKDFLEEEHILSNISDQHNAITYTNKHIKPVSTVLK